MSILNVENLTFGFGDKVILKNINFRLLKGEHAGLVGNNGAGKTTLFNILTGKLIPDEGNVHFMSSMNVGYLDQHICLEDDKSIMDNLRLAFKELYEKEKKILKISDELGSMDEELMGKALKELGDLQDKLLTSGFYNIDSTIKSVAGGLGLTALGLNTLAGKLSGGQRTKVSLAQLLLKKPDLLLLDEPTNYLDKEHVDWLSNYLKNYDGSFIVISHDTEFLNSVTNIILHLEFSNLTRYVGNYDRYLKLSEVERKLYLEQYNRQQKFIKETEKFIDANIVRTATTKMAKSRRKMLEKIDRLEKPQSAPKPAISFLTSRDSGKLIFKCENLDIGYNYPIIKGLNLKLTRGEKIAIIGCNGIGKSTLLKTILGDIIKLRGTINFGDFLKPAYFEQEVKNYGDITAMNEVWNEFPDKTQKEIREGLAKCGLRQEYVLRSMRKLSGGEQSKVRLCKLTMTPCNWLILDEPTNHLDVDSKDSLKEAIKAFKGTVLLVCHEKEFYEDFVTNVWNMEEYISGNRK